MSEAPAVYATVPSALGEVTITPEQDTQADIKGGEILCKLRLQRYLRRGRLAYGD